MLCLSLVAASPVGWKLAKPAEKTNNLEYNEWDIYRPGQCHQQWLEQTLKKKKGRIGADNGDSGFNAAAVLLFNSVDGNGSECAKILARFQKHIKLQTIQTHCSLACCECYHLFMCKKGSYGFSTNCD